MDERLARVVVDVHQRDHIGNVDPKEFVPANVRKVPSTSGTEESGLAAGFRGE
jgi:hypothetical protein